MLTLMGKPRKTEAEKAATAKARSQRYYQRHKAEINTRVNAYRKRNREKVRLWDRVRRQRRLENGKQQLSNRIKNLQKYGLTISDYDAMLAGQNGGCALCGRTNRNGKRLHVDHCHETGRVRGLLCSRCNTAIGLLLHDPKILRRAARFVTYSPEHRRSDSGSP